MSSTKLALVLWDIASVVGGILVSGVLFGRGAAKRSERQSRKGFSRAAKPRGKIPPFSRVRRQKQYSTLTLIPPATLATWDMALLRTMILPKILFSRV